MQMTVDGMDCSADEGQTKICWFIEYIIIIVIIINILNCYLICYLDWLTPKLWISYDRMLFVPIQLLHG